MKLVVISGSVFGNAQAVAEHAVARLNSAGHSLWYSANATLDEVLAQAPEAILVVTSTTGMGELPNNIQDFYYSARDRFPAWAGLGYGLIALGDSAYGDTFCGAGEQFVELFAELGLQSIQPILRLDASETVTPEADAEPWLDELIAALKSN